MDFFKIVERTMKNGTIELSPDFQVVRSKDLMTRAKGFYAVWDPDVGLWVTDEYALRRLVDKELLDYRESLIAKSGERVTVRAMSDFSTRSWVQFRNYIGNISDNYVPLDARLTFQNDKITKKDHVSKRLPYSLESGSISAYSELMTTLFDPTELAKLEWAIGAIIAGDAKDIQKFIVLYGDAGTGKSTILNIIQKLFEGYYTTFDAKALTTSSNSFSTEVFRGNPLVAIQHDGDLSRIEDNTKLNSIVSHEEMVMNEKNKPAYTARANCFLFMATNQAVKITDAKSGLIRRLIDVNPSGRKVPTRQYHNLMSQIEFELGAIAYHCREVYMSMGKNYYSSYRPLEMMFQTDVFFNFVEDTYFIFKDQDSTTLSQAYELYKKYCEESKITHMKPKHEFREQLRNYFKTFSPIARKDGKQVRSYYEGFEAGKFTAVVEVKKEPSPSWLNLDSEVSIFDTLYADCPAQLTTEKELPIRKWANVRTKLSSLDTKELHYVKVPEKLVVIDFDLRDESGAKSFSKNLEAASNWPPTYAELSKSGAGIHLHYIYEGDTSELKTIFSTGIEVKVFHGDASLRRKLTKCNTYEITVLKSGLPLKEKSMINFDSVRTERSLREIVLRNLEKGVHPATKPSIDFIEKLLSDAYKSGMVYDLSDLSGRVLNFAMASTNNREYCVKAYSRMLFKSKDMSPSVTSYEENALVFFDVEVFPNLLIVIWKFQGDNPCVVMVNPKPEDLEGLFKYKLVGFNCRRYDNHILYGRYLGYDNEQIYQLSKKIIKESRTAMFSEAYNISYADIFEFSSVKQSLKKFQIELGIHHKELGWPWDEPLPENLWESAIEYCKNDVISSEVVFNSRKEDFMAREILAELSGLSINDTTQQHAARIIFGNDPNPQREFVYTDLSERFPGYHFSNGKSTYRGEETGEGGYVYAEPGVYTNVALLDVASMHPSSIIALNAFGDIYTARYRELLEARIKIKHKKYDEAKTMLGGILAKYLVDTTNAKPLSNAMKIVLNIVYGLTSASFPNKFKDPRNIDNIVAKRGALFMIDLKHAVQEKGFTVAHIKTDSIKIPNATPEIIQFVFDFGKEYGYTFEHEETYEKFFLANNAVYIARSNGKWSATGTQFAQPYVFKTLFSKEPLVFSDYCETKSVATALVLDFNEDLPEGEHNYQFVGKNGLFTPVKPGRNGGVLLRKSEEGEVYHSATGAKDYRWIESEVFEKLRSLDDVDLTMYEKLAEQARVDIGKYTDFEWFIS